MNSILAFDTATERYSIALEVDGEVWHCEGEGGAKASSDFLPAIIGLLEQAGMRIGGLDAVAFGRGPGAFTGLRCACSVAQGLALGAGKPVLPIDTLLAVAENARDGRDPARIWALLDARMDEIYAAEYAFGAGVWEVCVAPMLTTPEALNRSWCATPPEFVAGNALAVFGSRLATGAACLRPAAAPRAIGMLALGRALWAQGGAIDAANAVPLYLRDKVAQTTTERAVRVPT